MAANDSTKICSVDSCEKAAWARGYCSKHLTRWKKHGDPLKVTARSEWKPKRFTLCSIDGCERRLASHGMCKKHYAVWWRHNGDKKCSIADCNRVSETGGLCQAHYARSWKYGDPLIMRHLPPGSSGGIGTSGYRLVNGRNEHIQIAERALGKSLPKGAQVHHVDGGRLNNSNDNLVICPSCAYHRLLHLRTAALDACGNANWRKCKFCRQYDEPSKMYGYPGGTMFHHRACLNADNRKRKATLVVEPF